MDYLKLAQFLNKVTPSIIKALDESYGTSAFEDYDPETNGDLFTNTELLQKINSTNETDFQVIVIYL